MLASSGSAASKVHTLQSILVCTFVRDTPQKTLKAHKMADLSKEDLDRVNFVWGIYDSTNEGVDAYYIGDLLRALELNPTLATIEKVGGTKKKGEKKLMVDEFYPIYSQVSKDKDQGVYEDFIECLKLYDKAEDGHMIGGELTHILLSLGEKLSDAELDEVVKDCMDPEDEDGMIPYVPFLAKVCDKPVPEDDNPFNK